MRISELFRLRFWSAGLFVVAIVGHSAVPVFAQTPPANVPGQSTTASDKVESWLRDAQTAIQQQKWDAADRALQVAEALIQTEGQPRPEVQSRIQTMRDQIKSSKGTGARSAVPAPQPNMPGVDFVSKDMESARGKLIVARQALAKGDVSTAQSALKQARETNIDFTSLGDSPERIEQLITRQNELANLARDPNNAALYNASAAAFLLEQGEQLLAYKDSVTAEFLATQAEKFPVDFAKMAMTPASLREKIKSSESAGAMAATPPAATNPTTAPAIRANVAKLMSQAQLAVDQQNWSEASRFIAQAKSMNLPDSAFAKDELRPWQLELIVDKALKQKGLSNNSPEVQLATNITPATQEQVKKGDVVSAEYDPNSDTTHNAPASYAQAEGEKVGSGVMPETPTPPSTDAKQDQTPEEIDLSSVKEEEQLLFRRLQQDVFKGRADADRKMKTDPRQALDTMVGLRSSIANSELSAGTMAPLLTIVDRDINEMQRFIQDNLSEIMNDEQNADRLESVELERERRAEVEQQVQQLVEKYNKLMDQDKLAEAEVIARQVCELDPDSEIATMMKTKAQIVSNTTRGNAIKEVKDQMQWEALAHAEEAGTPIDESIPMQFPDAESWLGRSRERAERLESRRFNSESERRIWNKLKSQKIQGNFTGSLAEAVSQIATQAGETIVFDNLALRAENVEASTTPIDANLSQPISLQSALNIILGDAGLTFVVENEVIKVTSNDAQSKRVEPRTYYVGDLIAPVTPPNGPAQMNFITPYQNMNSQNSLASTNGTGINMASGQSLSQMAMAQQMPANQNQFGGINNPMLMGAMNDLGGSGGPQRGVPMYTTMGAPQMGGITLQDFTPLINLITQTIAPDSWSTTQGEGTISPYVPNLSLIVSQTQAVHDEIQDMLTQLRKLNDVQIVVEVRFITMRDNFFERIGVDFDFKINDNSGLTAATVNTTDNFNPGVIVGRDAVNDRFVPTADLDIGLSQGSIGSSIPIFGGFDVGTAGSFGFAILSDIEVFFLIQASKGDQRTNLTQAPTVTMFNGQSATVSDFSVRPFVTSVTPVVGDFAVAQQPIVSLIPEGSSLNVTATASDDRRFVTMSLVPYFSEITDVKEFQFDGRRTTRQTSSSFLKDLLDQIDPTNNNTNNDPDVETVSEGVTVQQPVISFTSVSTVLSVPDGGTVLMGGLKQLREARTERGLPFLSNIPYLNRLFKNVGIGRETANLMLLVTPRIIIQEEEERKQVGPVGGN